MTDDEERLILERLKKEGDAYWEEQREHAFPDPPQTAGPPSDEDDDQEEALKKESIPGFFKFRDGK